MYLASCRLNISCGTVNMYNKVNYTESQENSGPCWTVSHSQMNYAHVATVDSVIFRSFVTQIPRLAIQTRVFTWFSSVSLSELYISICSTGKWKLKLSNLIHITYNQPNIKQYL